MIKVAAVVRGSIADELGIVPGTELLSVDGREVEDFLDWEFLPAEDQFLVHVRQPTREELEYDIERPAYLSLGLDLEPPRIVESDDRNTHRETVPELARPAGERLASCRRSTVRHRSGVNAKSQRSER